MLDKVMHRDGLALGQLTARLGALLGKRLTIGKTPGPGDAL